MAIKVEASTPTERTITLSMLEPDARRLKYLLTENVVWSRDRFGTTAQEIWDALDDLDVADEE